MRDEKKNYAIEKLRAVKDFVENSTWVSNIIKKYDIIDFIDKQIGKIKREK